MEMRKPDRSTVLYTDARVGPIIAVVVVTILIGVAI